MTAKSIVRSYISRPARISAALLLSYLLVFPEGLAASDPRCPSSDWTPSAVQLPFPPGGTVFGGLETMAAAVNNNFLYAIGGYDLYDNVFQNQVSYSKLDTTLGSLGTFLSLPLWTDSTTGQPAQLARYLCGVVNAGYLYTIDGVINEPGAGPTATNQIWFAKINSDGSLRAWQQAATVFSDGTQLPALQLAATVAVSNHLYIIGGSTATGAQWNTPSCCVVGHTYYAKIKTDGSLGVFAKGPDIPVNTTFNKSGHLYKTCPVVYNSTPNPTIYIAGGENNSGALQTVYYASPDPITGSFPNGKWNQETGTSMLPLIDAAQAVAYNNGINLIAGDQLGNGHDWPCVVQGEVSSAGSITWSLGSVPQLPVSVSRNAGATNASFIYSLGGNQGGSDQYDIYYRSLP